MSVTEREVPFEVARKGGFPTAEEFKGVDDALYHVQEYGLGPLLERIARPLVEAYEGEADAKVDFTHADLGLLAAKARFLVESAEWALEGAKKLQAIAVDVGDAVEFDGNVDHDPKFSPGGQQYTPSREALERWGLAKPKEATDAS